MSNRITVQDILADHPEAKRAGDGWLIRCPAHDDSDPSLKIAVGDGGRVLVRCHAGCDQVDVLRALGLGGNGERPPNGPSRPANGVKPPAKGEGLQWLWKTAQAAQEAFEPLTLAGEDEQARTFLYINYGLTPDAIPADWRIFVHPKHGRGLVYPGNAADSSPVYKFKALARNPETGKRQPAFLHGAGGCLALASDPNRPWVIVGGEEKAAAARAAGYNVLAPLTGEKALANEWVEWVLAPDPKAPRPIRIILANDHDEPGRKANLDTARKLELAGFPADQIRVMAWPADAPSGFDLNDLAKADGLEAVRLALEKAPVYQSVIMPPITSAETLQGKEFCPPREIIKGLRPEGLTILAARPKKGKSWEELGNAIAIASGGVALGLFVVERGAVLYLALEDSERRIQQRMERLHGADKWPPNLFFAYTWPRLDRNGLEALRAWLYQHPDAAMIVVDTFTRIRPPKDAKGDAYQQDADATALLQRLALDHHVAIVLIVHQRKASADDPFDTISGTLGMTASADVVAVLTREPKSGKGQLAITGRDIEERTLAMFFDGGRWSCTGDVDDETESDPLEAAKGFLTELLKDGPVESEKIFEQGKAQGFRKKDLYAAKDASRIKARKLSYRGAWQWELPSV